jgi:hypothetical protein
MVRVGNKIGLARIPKDLTPDDPLEYSKHYDEVAE